MKVRILDLARDDLIAGYSFYERRESGLGSTFLECLFADIGSLEQFGGVHRIAYRDFRRLLSERFPFAVYYTMNDDIVLVRSVVDCRRKPSWIADHLDKA